MCALIEYSSLGGVASPNLAAEPQNMSCRSMAGGVDFFQDQAPLRARRRPGCSEIKANINGCIFIRRKFYGANGPIPWENG